MVGPLVGAVGAGARRGGDVVVGPLVRLLRVEILGVNHGVGMHTVIIPLARTPPMGVACVMRVVYRWIGTSAPMVVYEAIRP